MLSPHFHLLVAWFHLLTAQPSLSPALRRCLSGPVSWGDADLWVALLELCTLGSVTPCSLGSVPGRKAAWALSQDSSTVPCYLPGQMKGRVSERCPPDETHSGAVMSKVTDLWMKTEVVDLTPGSLWGAVRRESGEGADVGGREKVRLC